MGDRGSKSVGLASFEGQSVTVKEQRVDGSSIKYNGKVYSSCRETGFWVKKKLVYLMLILGTDGHYSIQQHVT